VLAPAGMICLSLRGRISGIRHHYRQAAAGKTIQNYCLLFLQAQPGGFDRLIIRIL
jgi:hypothetical protein